MGIVSYNLVQKDIIEYLSMQCILPGRNDGGLKGIARYNKPPIHRAVSGFIILIFSRAMFWTQDLPYKI